MPRLRRSMTQRVGEAESYHGVTSEPQTDGATNVTTHFGEDTNLNEERTR